MSSSSGGQPRTVDVRLSGPAVTQTYSLPPGVTFDVEAIYIEVDTTGAGGAVTCELTISEQSGVVIAKKTQGATIPAGGSGTATWALRLTDELAGGGGGAGDIKFDFDNEGGGLAVRTNAPSVFGFYGTDLRDTSNGINIEAEANGAVTIGADGTGTVNLYATDGDLTLGTQNGGFDLTVGAGGNGILLDNNSSGDTVITADGATANLHLRANDTLDLAVATGGSGFLTIQNLPIVNPGGTGRVWNDAGVLKIT